MKKFIGLTTQEAMDLALAQGREVEYFEGNEDEYERLEVSTCEGNGAALLIEDGVVFEYEYLDWI